MMKKLSGIGVTFCSVILALLACEGAVRIIDFYYPFRFFQLDFPDRKGGFYEYDRDLGWKNRPGYHRYHRKRHGTVLVEINAQGWRDQEYPVVKDEDVYRIAVLGCSFTFGEGVNSEQAFPKLLEKMLNETSDQKIEVLNFGVNGYGIDQMAINYNKFVRHYQPDVVLMQFFDFNAYRTLHSVMWRTQKPRFILHDGKLKLENHPVPMSRFKSFEKWLLEKSKLYKLIKEKWLTLEYFRNKRIKDGIAEDKDLHRLSEEILKFLKKKTDEGQARLIIFVKGGRKQSWTERIARSAGVEVFNLNRSEDVRTWQEKGKLFNPYPDQHWSVLGNQYVATAIFNYFKKKNVGNFFHQGEL